MIERRKSLVSCDLCGFESDELETCEHCLLVYCPSCDNFDLGFLCCGVCEDEVATSEGEKA